jgi:hypothetical protein
MKEFTLFGTIAKVVGPIVTNAIDDFWTATGSVAEGSVERERFRWITELWLSPIIGNKAQREVRYPFGHIPGKTSKKVRLVCPPPADDHDILNVRVILF